MPGMTRRALSLTAGGLLLLATGSSAVQAQDTRSYILATATTGGTYYPVGVALATLVKVKLEPGEKVSMSAISSAGSGENVKLLREDQAQFGILQGLFGAYAWALLGSCALEEDDPREAERWLLAAIDDDPQDRESQVKLALARARLSAASATQ